ncbi:metal dependent phosphohydrolase [Treponema primitia ZAS-2]|uniref:Metal dependent phosphohydrolase n=1 Tax=Treponema primitia (strain ATCC BAA-887 / DSM 12427 / ZAS-2) TaxID=545694 RepID=F5YMP7_TREPZ|nr:HD domain-containing phosphohydrolase [Treponema primitia]AEF86662.1 metal dependent phosphohydrolase [Treponema primitia ZAS-2]
MNIRMDKLIQTIGAALDIVEGELLGASTNHGKRIAVLSAALGQHLGMEEDRLFALTSCALLHDNALTEYIAAEYRGEPSGNGSGQNVHMKLHCQLGQRNVDTLGFKTGVKDFILYHHERADGSGPYGKRNGEFPLEAELIAISDNLDVTWGLQNYPGDELPKLRSYIEEQAGMLYTGQAAKAMLAVLDQDMLQSLRDKQIAASTGQYLSPYYVDIEDAVILRLADLITRIIDYKSKFTRRHSTQIASKAWAMGGHYRYSPTLRSKLYLAASLHDIGKLATPTTILEKPGRLTDDEFRIITDHVRLTHDLLANIEGLDEIHAWASNHHEKLDGSGYPFGKKAGELDFNSRLMACIDIYQAVSEERPYHPQRNHRDTMAVLYSMAEKGALDQGIVRDMDEALAAWDGGDIPAP